MTRINSLLKAERDTKLPEKEVNEIDKTIEQG
jgi:hypothetical protein